MKLSWVCKIAISTKTIALSKMPFKKFCGKREVSRNQVLKNRSVGRVKPLQIVVTDLFKA